MSDNIFNDKVESMLKRIGHNIQEQRTKVFRATHEEFAAKIESATGKPFDKEHLYMIEAGKGVPTDELMKVLCILQVGETVTDATKSNSSLFLAAAKRISGIEEEMRRNTPE